MNIELCLVEILVERFNVGDEEYLQHLQDATLLAIFQNGKLQITDEIEDFCISEEKTRETSFQDDPLSLAYYPKAKITQVTWGFIFNIIGENNDGEYSCGLEWEASEKGYNEVFAESLDVLRILAERKLLDRKDRGLDPGKKQRIITLWEYATWFDSYSNEPEAEYNLIGIVDFEKLKQVFSQP